MEVLNTYSKANEFLTIIPIFSIPFIIFFIIYVIGNFICKEWKNALICFIWALAISLITYGTMILSVRSETKFQEVIISDYNKVDFNKYEIVEQKGKITVLKEKK